MQRKFLEDMGLEKDIIDKIMAENGNDINTAKSTGSKDLQDKITELGMANDTIRKLQENAKKFEGVNLEDMNSRLEKAQQEIKQTKIDAALQVALANSNAVDVDYLLFKAKSSDKKVDIDGNGKVTGVDDLVSELKTSCPSMFAKSGKLKVEEHKLEEGNNNGGESEPVSLADALRQAYEKTDE